MSSCFHGLHCFEWFQQKGSFTAGWYTSSSGLASHTYHHMQLKVQGTGRFLNLTLLWWKHQSQTLPIKCKTDTTYTGMLANRFSITKALAAQNRGGSTTSCPACDLNDALLQRSQVPAIQLAPQPCSLPSHSELLHHHLTQTTPSQPIQGPHTPI